MKLADVFETILDDDCMEELEELIIYDIKSGFLNNEEIQEDCVLYLETNYPDEYEAVTAEMFRDVVREMRLEHQNTGTQENYKKLRKAFDDMEKLGIVTEHFAGYTMDDGFEIVNERATEQHKRGETLVGCCFYIQQDLIRQFEYGSKKLQFTFGNYFENPTAEKVGEMIVEVLQKNGFETEWNGSADRKIAIVDFEWDKICEE